MCRIKHQHKLNGLGCLIPVILMLLLLIPNASMAAGVGVLSGSIPNDGSYHVVHFNVPGGTTFTVVKLALDIGADPTKQPDFRIYEKTSNQPVAFDNPNDVKTVKFGGGPTDNLADVKWYCDPASVNTCAADRILIFRFDHSIRSAGTVTSDEVWTLEIKNNDTAPREFFLGVGNSSNTDPATALTEATKDSEVPHIKIISEDPDFGEVLPGIPESDVARETLKITNVGTGVLSILTVKDPDEPAFSRSLVTTPFDITPFTSTPLNVEIGFNPQHHTVIGEEKLGPFPAEMEIESDSYFEASKKVTISATLVQLELGLLFDVSGSMNDTPDGKSTTNPHEAKLKLAKEAGSAIQDILPGFEGSKVRMGLFTFPKYGGATVSAETIQSMDQYDNVKQRLRDAWADSGTYALKADGRTPMPEGLHEAHGLIPGNFSGPGSWTQGQYVRRALLLLSDGQSNEDSDRYPETPAAWATYAKSITDPAQKIRVFPVWFGKSEAAATAAHWNNLQDLAKNSGGGFFNARAGDTGALKIKFRQALIEWRDWSTIADPKSSLTRDGSMTVHEVCIDDSVHRIAFNVDWKKVAASSIDFALEGPDGDVDPSSPDVAFHTGDTYATYIVKGSTARGNPGSDKWKLKLSGGQGLAEGEAVEYYYSVIAKSKTKVESDFGDIRMDTHFKEHLMEVRVSGLKPKIKARAVVKLMYDVPAESMGAYMSVTEGFDPEWLVREEYATPESGEAQKQTRSANTQTDVVTKPFAPLIMNGETADLVQRKAYALSNFANHPFTDRRATGEIELYDDGTHGDKVAGDGIYSAYLPATQFDGLAKFGLELAADDEDDCINRELWWDKTIAVALTSDLITSSVTYADAQVTFYFPPSLVKLLKAPPPSGYERKSIVVRPQDANGNPLGPGYGDQVRFSIRNAEAIDTPVDNLDGSYIQMIQYRKGEKPMATVSVGGVTSTEVPMPAQPEPSVSGWWWLPVILLVLILLWFMGRIRRTP